MKQLSKNHWMFLGATLMCFLLIIIVACKGNAQHAQAAENHAQSNAVKLGAYNVYLPISLSNLLDESLDKGRHPRKTATQTPTSLPDLPDLVITSFYQTMQGYEPGGCVDQYAGFEFRVTVMNAGTAAAGYFEVAVNDSVQSIDGLAAGESVTLHYPLPLHSSIASVLLTATFTPTPTATPDLTATPTPTLAEWPGEVVAVADWTDLVIETDETNNTRSTYYIPSTQAPPCTLTPTPTPIYTHTPTPTPGSGLVIKGYVLLADGSGVPNVAIYRAFASYEGQVVAITDENGYYESAFQYIPGDEMVRVWAESDAYTVEPAESWAGDDGVYDWRHYYGYEEKVLAFTAKLSGASPTPTATAYCRTNQQCSP